MEDEHTQLSEDAKKIILDIFAPVMERWNHVWCPWFIPWPWYISWPCYLSIH